MPASWIAKSNAGEVRLAHAAGKTGDTAIDSALARADTATAGTDAALRKGQVAAALTNAARLPGG